MTDYDNCFRDQHGCIEATNCQRVNKENPRIGLDGTCAMCGDLCEVVKGRKYPKGMKFYAECHGEHNYNAYLPHHVKWDESDLLVFGGEGRMETIDASNVKIIG